MGYKKWRHWEFIDRWENNHLRRSIYTVINMHYLNKQNFLIKINNYLHVVPNYIFNLAVKISKLDLYIEIQKFNSSYHMYSFFLVTLWFSWKIQHEYILEKNIHIWMWQTSKSFCVYFSLNLIDNILELYESINNQNQYININV